MAASAVGELAELPFDDPGSQVAGPPYCPVGARVRQPAADALLFGGQNAGLGLQLPVEDVAADDDEVGPAGCHAAGVADVEAVEAEEVAEVGDGLLQVAFLDEPVAAGRPIPGGSLPRHAGGLLPTLPVRFRDSETTRKWFGWPAECRMWHMAGTRGRSGASSQVNRVGDTGIEPVTSSV
jgi:hypothetical protein